MPSSVSDLEVDDPLVDRVLALVDVRDEVADAAVVLELVAVVALARSSMRTICEALGQEGGLAQALDKRLGGEIDLLEDVGVGQEA